MSVDRGPPPKPLGCPANEVFIASTGVIGEPLPCREFAALPALLASLRDDALGGARRGHHDHRHLPQGGDAHGEIGGVEVRINGIAKGTGMIAPDMATMLAFSSPTRAIDAGAAAGAAAAAASTTSFNCITVDGDTSTSDTLLLFATGQAARAPPASPMAATRSRVRGGAERGDARPRACRWCATARARTKFVDGRR